VHRLVGTSVEDTLHSADTLRGLAHVLNSFGDLQRTADVAVLRCCATGVQAAGLQALLPASQGMAGISQRFTACALAPEKLGTSQGP